MNKDEQLDLITSTKEVMHLLACVFVSEQDNSKSYRQI